MMDIQLGDELHFKNGEVSRVVGINKMYQDRGFYLDLLTPVHRYIGEDQICSHWGYNPDGTVTKPDQSLVCNDIKTNIHRGIDDFLHLYTGDVIITSNGSEAKIAEDVVLLQRQTIVRLMDKININTETYKARKIEYITIDRNNLLIMSSRGPDTRIIKIIRGDRKDEDLHAKSE